MKAGKKFFLGFCGLVVIGLVAAAIQSSASPKDSQPASASNQNSTIKVIIETTSCSNDQAQNIRSILYDCGFSDKEIATITPLAEREQGGAIYEMDGNLARPLMLVLDAENVVEEINIKMSTWQLYAEYEKIWALDDFRITFEEKQQYRDQARDMVTAMLKSPSTARYPGIDSWTIVRQEGKVIVQGYVDAQNSFGAMIRSEFQVIFNSEDNIESFVFDGVEIM